MRHTFSYAILLIPSLALSACASMPAELAAGGPYLDVMPSQVLGGEYEQRRVRWGGLVIQALPQDKRTCFEMTGLALDKVGEPVDSDISTGRFMACADGFYDPAIYSAKRHVTFTGHIQGSAPHKIGNQVFEFPKIEANRVYLWPKRSKVIYVPYSINWPQYEGYYFHHPAPPL